MTTLEAALVPASIAHREGGGAWLIVGPAGSGKSWTLHRLVELMDDRHVRWLHATGIGTGGRSFAAALGLETSDNTSTGMIEQLGGSVVLIDDVADLDDADLETLEGLAAAAVAADVVVVSTLRSSAGRVATARVATRSSVIELGPLDPLRPTFREVAGDLSEQDSKAVLAATGGWCELVAVHPAIAGGDAATALVGPRLEATSPEARAFATALAFGASLDDGSVEELTGTRGADLDALMVALEAGGLLHGAVMTPLVADAVRGLTPVGARRALLARVVTMPVSGAVAPLADWLLTTPDRSPEALEVMVAAALARPPADQLPLLEAAVEAGADADVVCALVNALLGVGRARAALGAAVRAELDGPPLRNALGRAGRLADAALVPSGAPVEAAADDIDDYVLAALAAGVGDLARAESLLGDRDAPVIGPRAAALALADAAVALVQGDRSALHAVRDAARLAGDGVDTATWVIDPGLCALIVATASLASRGNDDARAAVGSSQATAFAPQAEIVGAWQAMRAGRLHDVRLSQSERLDPLEGALTATLDASLALRSDQLDALGPKVADAIDAMTAVQLDIWRLPLAVELLAPAARVGLELRSVDELCRPVLDRCSSSSIIRISYAAALLLAALSADDADAVSVAAELVEATDGTTPAHRIFADVAPVARDVFDGVVDTDAVLAAAGALRDAGLVYDAGRLTGAAAMRSSDERAAKTLLRESRAMRQERRVSGRSGGDVTELSEREVEVARLVVQGRTHKEVGATLFISAKTVEHHVARIRNKLGASGRAEMMAAIRDYLDATDNLDETDGALES